VFGENKIVGRAYFKDAPKNTLTVTSMFLTLQGEGPFRGEPAFFIRLAKCNLSCSFCFPGNTSVTMADSSKRKIKDVNEGEFILSWDERSNEFAPKRVAKVHRRTTEELLRISCSPAKIIFATREHPFLVKNKGWVKAGRLKADDVIMHFSSSDRMKLFNPMKNPVTSKKVADKKRGKPGYLNVAWKDEEFRRKNVRRMKEHNPMKNPATAIKGFLNRKDRDKQTATEQRFSNLMQDYCQFVGGGDLVVDYLCPDFLIKGQRKLVEVWHSDQTTYLGRDATYKARRAKRFAKEGYETLFLPFCDKDTDESIREKVLTFMRNGYTVETVTSITKEKRAAWVRFTGSKEEEAIDVYNLAVEDTHTYLAENLIVHNCDTFFDHGEEMTFGEITFKITDSIENYYNGKPPTWAVRRRLPLVITGGEPMLQPNLADFVKSVGNTFKCVQIETNGTQPPGDLPEETVLVVSPKCLQKKGKAPRYLMPRKETRDRADCLKFVMSADKESPYSEVPDWAHDWHELTGKPIFISPMNIYSRQPTKQKEVVSFWETGLLNMEENKLNHEYSARYCVEHGYTLNLQLQLYASLA